MQNISTLHCPTVQNVFTLGNRPTDIFELKKPNSKYDLSKNKVYG